jgi:hypothetical protein
MKTSALFPELLKESQTWQNCWAYYWSIVTYVLKLSASYYRYIKFELAFM